ncbi:MAG: antitoxin VbhA family protein [Gallionella sp.]|nr:antitoxin VbhA family protein [Gallionella sp.]
MTSFIANLIIRRTLAENAQERKRAAFRYANASLALEGFATDRAQLARQEEIIHGGLTTEQAIAKINAKYGRS